MKPIIYCFVAFTLLTVCGSSDAVTAVVSKNGQVKLPVCYANNASPATVAAANELSHYLHLITGIAAFEPAQSNATATTAGILVGTYDMGGVNGQGDFPTLGLSKQLPVDGNVTCKEAFVVWVHAPNQVWVIGKSDLGSPHAVYRLLDFLGCRWFFQGANWEVVPTMPNITLNSATLHINDRPLLGQRVLGGYTMHDGVDVKSGPKSGVDENLWRRRNHLADATGNNNSLNIACLQVWFWPISNINAHDFDGNHTTNWFNYGQPTDPHPAPPANRYGWFAKGINPNGPYKCLTLECANPEVWDKYFWWATNSWWSRYPQQETVPVTPSDGTVVISESPQALALGNGSQSDQICTLVNQMANRTSQSPDSNINWRSAAFLAGYTWAEPPSFAMASNVYVSLLVPRVYSSQSHTNGVGLMSAWKAKGIKGLGVWDNYSYWPGDRAQLLCGYSSGSVSPSAEFASDLTALKLEYQKMVSNGVKSVVLETTDNFGALGLGYYTIAKLMWNPNVDLTALRNDFYSKAFGSASNDMRNFYTTLDPHNGPMLVGKDLFARACDSLTAAAMHAGGDARAIARINDLKLNMYYNALWYNLYQIASPNPAVRPEMINLVKQILSAGYRTRYSYMMDWGGTQSGLLNAARIQFEDSPEWNYANSNATWRTPSTFPSQEEIDAAWTIATNTFTRQPVAQVTWNNDLVAVTNFGSPHSITAGAPTKPVTLALYATNTATTVSLKLNTSGFNPKSAGITVVLVDKGGVAVGSETLLPGRSWTNLTFAVPRSKEAYIATVDPHGAFANTVSPKGSAMSILLDKTTRIGTANCSYLDRIWFYVPKNTTSIQFFWKRQAAFGPGYEVAMPAINPNMTAHVGTNTVHVFTELIAPNGATNSCPPDRQLATIPVPAGQDGKLWYLHNFLGSQLWFYNIPNLVATDPGSLLVPRSLAIADGLTIR